MRRTAWGNGRRGRRIVGRRRRRGLVTGDDPLRIEKGKSSPCVPLAMLHIEKAPEEDAEAVGGKVGGWKGCGG